MKRPGKIATVLLLACAVGGLLFFLLYPSEPSYRGKSLTQWIAGMEYVNENPTDEQRAALRAMGKPAVQRLIVILQSHDSKLKRNFIRYAYHHGGSGNYYYNWIIYPRHVIPERIYHADAATALGEIGPAAAAAIPVLMAVSATNYDGETVYRAKAALIKIRQEPIEPLLEQLQDTHSIKNWAQAAGTIRHLGTNAEAAVPLLINALQSTNLGVRQYAVWGLSGIASRPDISVPALVACLEDKDAGIRRDAIDALCKFPQAKEQIVPLLLARMQETDNNVWLGAAFGLEHLLNQDEKRTLYIPALIKSLNNRDETICINAATFLKRNDPAAAAKAGVK